MANYRINFFFFFLKNDLSCIIELFGQSDVRKL